MLLKTNLLKKSIITLKDEGFITLVKKITAYLLPPKKIVQNIQVFVDVLFINGCTLPHPSRYRVAHQMEQLLANNFSSNQVFYLDIKENMIKSARAFVFFRCPITLEIEAFIKKAKEHNKIVFFDVDDLVIDTKYTEQIEYLKTLSQDELNLYNDGVNRMKATMMLCDYGITTTGRLQTEMFQYVSEVYLNRNVASEEMVKLSLQAQKKVLRDEKKIILGYLSGSITHNSDFALILPVITKLMDVYDNLYIKIVGILEIPEELKKYKNRILTIPFVTWTKLPDIIASIDINLAPLEKTIFNEAKSENKWVEAALCKVVTVASNVGAFKDCVQHNITGILCDDEHWYAELNELILNTQKRMQLAENAFHHVIKECVTTYTGFGLTKFISSKLKRNFFFVLPSTNISGGVNVALKHCQILKRKGFDVSILNMAQNEKNIKIQDDEIIVLDHSKYNFCGKIDSAVATLWSTVSFLHKYSNILNRYYLVQNYETDFYKYGSTLRFSANATYNSFIPIKYITISKWCESWLENEYYQSPKFAPNGINLNQFVFKQRKFEDKIRILIEGNPDAEYKNVDESFKIVEKLDKNKFEIFFLSYEGQRKDWYYVDTFLHKVPYEKVGGIYQNADILLKSSKLESFSYPPLEMMATGGIAVVAPNEGNSEYLVDEQNCLLYPLGDIDKAVEQILRICNDENLRTTLINYGLKTAQSRDWNLIEKEILNLYDYN